MPSRSLSGRPKKNSRSIQRNPLPVDLFEVPIGVKPPRRPSSKTRERKAKADEQGRKADVMLAMRKAFKEYGPQDRPAKKTSLQRLKSRARKLKSYVGHKLRRSPRSKSRF